MCSVFTLLSALLVAQEQHRRLSEELEGFLPELIISFSMSTMNVRRTSVNNVDEHSSSRGLRALNLETDCLLLIAVNCLSIEANRPVPIIFSCESCSFSLEARGGIRNSSITPARNMGPKFVLYGALGYRFRRNGRWQFGDEFVKKK